MSEPLTDEQHTAIRQRHAQATGGTWYLQPNHGRDFVATEQAGYERGIGDLDFGVGDQADADREFVLNAHTDMTALFAEVARLRTQRDGLAATVAQVRETCTTVTADRAELWDQYKAGELGMADAILHLLNKSAQPTT